MDKCFVTNATQAVMHAPCKRYGYTRKFTLLPHYFCEVRVVYKNSECTRATMGTGRTTWCGEVCDYRLLTQQDACLLARSHKESPRYLQNRRGYVHTEHAGVRRTPRAPCPNLGRVGFHTEYISECSINRGQDSCFNKAVRRLDKQFMLNRS